MRNSTARSLKRGFTLIELLLVLVLVAFVLGLSQMLFTQVQRTHSAILAEAQRGDAVAAGSIVLRLLLRNAAATSDSSGRFSGDQQSADFTTRCPTPGGWFEPCRVVLSVEHLGDSSTVLAKMTSGASLPLFSVRGDGQLRYLDRAARDTAWLARWGTSIVLPSALALIFGRDTVAFPTGDGNG